MRNKILLFTLITILVSCQKKETVKTPISNIPKTVKIKPEQTKKNNASIICIDVIIKILETAPSYIEKTRGLQEAIVKNGGTSFGITVEGSPNPENDKALNYSGTYDLNLHETYPDRMVTIDRYTFDPSKNELYKYDAVEDTLQLINFNKDLLLEYHKICK
jgi:hypothetical protein